MKLTHNYELESFLTGFADQVEVLEPEALRIKMGKWMAGAAEKYN